MDEEEMIGMITRLLEQGCTMLAAHHSCGAPLFRCKGEIVCPVCSFSGEAGTDKAEQENRQAIEERPAIEKPREQEWVVEKSQPEVASEIADQEMDQRMVEKDLRDAILYKVRSLATGLRSEQDMSRLKSQLESLEGALRVLRMLER